MYEFHCTRTVLASDSVSQIIDGHVIHAVREKQISGMGPGAVE